MSAIIPLTQSKEIFRVKYKLSSIDGMGGRLSINTDDKFNFYKTSKNMLTVKHFQ